MGTTGTLEASSARSEPLFLAYLWAVYANRQGRRPVLEVIVDLTSLEKTGAFPNFEIHQLGALGSK
jgi:hypothetical protein